MNDDGMSVENLQSFENNPEGIGKEIDKIDDENKSLLLESGISPEEIQLVTDDRKDFGVSIVSKIKGIAEKLQSNTGKRVATAGLILGMLTTSACAASSFASVTMVPTASQTPVATEKIDYEATATVQAEEIKKAERKEKEERLKEIDTTWTFEWFDSKAELEDPIEEILEESWKDARNDKYLKERGVKPAFLYLFVDDTESGWITAGGPYVTYEKDGYELNRYDARFFTESRIVDQKLCDKMIASTTDHYIDWENYTVSFNPDEEYTNIYYFTQEEDEYGKYTDPYSIEGGWYRIYEKVAINGEKELIVEYISSKDGSSKLTDQELDWALEYHNIFDYRFGGNGIGRGDIRILKDQATTPAPDS